MNELTKSAVWVGAIGSSINLFLLALADAQVYPSKMTFKPVLTIGRRGDAVIKQAAEVEVILHWDGEVQSVVQVFSNHRQPSSPIINGVEFTIALAPG